MITLSTPSDICQLLASRLRLARLQRNVSQHDLARMVYEGHGERLLLGSLAQVKQRLVFEYSSQAIAWAQQNHVEFSALHYPIPQASSWAPFVTGPRHFGYLPGFIADAQVLADLPIRSSTLAAMRKHLNEVWSRLA